MRALVCLPTYNEAQNVAPLVAGILEQHAGLEVLVIDDSSPDGTADLVRSLQGKQPRLHLLQRPGKLGLGTAYLAGFRHALERGYDYVLTMDADFSHHPRYLPDLLAGMDRHDLMIGSRYVPGGGIARWPLRRRLLSAGANAFTRLCLRLSVRDCTSGMRCYRRELLEAIDPFQIRASGYSFLEEMVWRVDRAGWRIGETPILFEDRVAGSSKIDRKEILRAARHVLATAFRRAPKVSKRASRA